MAIAGAAARQALGRRACGTPGQFRITDEILAVGPGRVKTVVC
jgi:hypothetical protein